VPFDLINNVNADGSWDEAALTEEILRVKPQSGDPLAAFKAAGVPAAPMSTLWGRAHEGRLQETGLKFIHPDGSVDEYSFGRMRQIVAEMCEEIRRRGLNPGDTLISATPFSPLTAFLHIASWFTGTNHAPVRSIRKSPTPGDMAAVKTDIKNRLDLLGNGGNSANKLLVATSDYRIPEVIRELFNNFIEAGDPQPRHFFEAAADEVGLPPAARVPPLGYVVTIATTGTSGGAKFVRNRQYQYASNAAAMAAHMELGPKSKFLGVLDLAHANGIMRFLACCGLTGAQMVMTPRFDPKAYLKIILENDTTHHALVPFQYTQLIQYVEKEMDGWQRAGLKSVLQARDARFFSSADKLPLATRTKFFEVFGIPLQEAYGSSEGMVYITGQSVEEVRHNSTLRSIGEVLPGQCIKLMKAEDPGVRFSPDYVGEEIAGTGQQGVIHVQVMEGDCYAHTDDHEDYYNDAEGRRWWISHDLAHREEVRVGDVIKLVLVHDGRDNTVWNEKGVKCSSSDITGPLDNVGFQSWAFGVPMKRLAELGLVMENVAHDPRGHEHMPIAVVQVPQGMTDDEAQRKFIEVCHNMPNEPFRPRAVFFVRGALQVPGTQPGAVAKAADIHALREFLSRGWITVTPFDPAIPPERRERMFVVDYKREGNDHVVSLHGGGGHTDAEVILQRPINEYFEWRQAANDGSALGREVVLGQRLGVSSALPAVAA